MADSDQRMYEHRNLCRKGEFGNDEIGLHMTGTGTFHRSIVAAEIRSQAEQGQNLIGWRELVATEIDIATGATRNGGASDGTGADLAVFRWRAGRNTRRRA